MPGASGGGASSSTRDPQAPQPLPKTVGAAHTAFPSTNSLFGHWKYWGEGLEATPPPSNIHVVPRPGNEALVAGILHRWCPEGDLDRLAVNNIFRETLCGSNTAGPALALVPGHALSAIEQGGVEAWRNTAIPGATTSAARDYAAAVTSEAQGNARAPHPSTESPECMHSGTKSAAMAPSHWLSPPPPPPAGSAAAVNYVGLRNAHTPHCARCRASPPAPCYAATLARECVGHSITWTAEGPPALVPLWPAGAGGAARRDGADEGPSVADAAVIDAFVEKSIASGVLTVAAADAQGYVSRVFVTTPFDAVLSSEDEARCSVRETDPLTPSTGIMYALSVATALALVFMSTLHAVTGLTKGPVPPPQERSYFGAFCDALATILTPRKPRVVANLRAVNEYVEAWHFRLQSLWTLLSIMRPGGWFAKADLKAGFYHIAMAALSQPYLTFHWRGQALSFARLPMGLSTSPALFSWLTAEVNRILREQGIDASLVYLDDFILYGHTYESCEKALAMFRALCAQLGLELAADKTSDAPTQHIVALGLEVDSTVGLVNIPAARLVRTLTYAAIVCACEERCLPVPGFFLASLGGSIGRLAYVDPLLRPFTRVALDLVFTQRRSRALAAIKPDVLAAVQFVLGRATGGLLRGQAILPAVSLRSGRAMWVTSDATASNETNALAYTLARHTTRYNFTTSRVDIVLLEFLAPLLFVLRHGNGLRGAFLIFGLDNTASHLWGDHGRAQRPEALDLIRVLYTALDHYGITAVFRWLPRWVNHLNDRVVAAPDYDAARAVHSELGGKSLAAVTLDGTIEDLVMALLHDDWPPALPPTFRFCLEWQTPPAYVSAP